MTELRLRYDAVVVGAGMAGASLAAELAPHMSVLLVEMEDMPGYHATGRSVAFWMESYGGPAVAPLTRASLPLLETPCSVSGEAGFLSPRGALHIGKREDAALRDKLLDDFAGRALFVPLDADVIHARISGLRPGWSIGLEEPGVRDIDVAALHAACLKALRRAGGTLICGSPLRAARPNIGGGWSVTLASGEVGAGMIINAAGAWADAVAGMCGIRPLGIAPLRRTVAQLRIDPAAMDSLPLVIDLAGSFYFKPVGGGRVWLSPHDEHPSAATDVAPGELDVAIAIDRFQAVVDWRVEAVERQWAGLRSFAPDRRPVYGRDPDQPDFFWFAGQGGFGIQTAPAAAKLGRRLLLGGGEPGPVMTGIDPALYDPARLR